MKDKLPTRDEIARARKDRDGKGLFKIDVIAQAYAEHRLVEPMGSEELITIIKNWWDRNEEGRSTKYYCESLADALLNKVGKKEE